MLRIAGTLAWLPVVCGIGGCADAPPFLLSEGREVTVEDLARVPTVARIDLLALSHEGAFPGSVAFAVMSPSGESILLAMRDGTPRFWLIGLDGEVRSTFGRAGGGPQEFGRIESVQFLSADTLLVSHGQNVTAVTTEGEVVAREPARRLGFRPHLVVGRCGDYVILAGLGGEPEAGFDGRPPWLWLADRGWFAAGRADSAESLAAELLLTDPVSDLAAQSGTQRATGAGDRFAIGRRTLREFLLLRGSCASGEVHVQVDTTATEFRNWRLGQLAGTSAEEWGVRQATAGDVIILPPLFNQGFAFDRDGRWIIVEREYEEPNRTDTKVALYRQLSDREWVRHELPEEIWLRGMGPSGELILTGTERPGGLELLVVSLEVLLGEG